MLESGRILAARYRLLRKLGEGRTTQVWLARDAETGADLVLKVLLSESGSDRARFLAAAALQQQVRHRNVQPCEAVHDGDPVFAVFAHVATGDLARLRGRPWREWLPALAGVADGVAMLHALLSGVPSDAVIRRWVAATGRTQWGLVVRLVAAQWDAARARGEAAPPPFAELRHRALPPRAARRAYLPVVGAWLGRRDRPFWRPSA
jgi:hypothetical protein